MFKHLFHTCSFRMVILYERLNGRLPRDAIYSHVIVAVVIRKSPSYGNEQSDLTFCIWLYESLPRGLPVKTSLSYFIASRMQLISMKLVMVGQLFCWVVCYGWFNSVLSWVLSSENGFEFISGRLLTNRHTYVLDLHFLTPQNTEIVT